MLRQRKFSLLRQFQLPQDPLPGSRSVSYTRCGKPTCHCAQGEKHVAWRLTFMAAGKKRVERIPKDWVDHVRRRVAAGPRLEMAIKDGYTGIAMDISIAEAKNRLTQLIRAVEQGESIVITRNGKPVARLAPPPPKRGLYGSTE